MDSVYIDGMFKTNTGLVKKATEGIPAEQWLLKPGDTSNHLLWIMGHLVWSRGNILRTLGSSWELSWAKQFSRGATCGDPSEYPPMEEIRKAWVDVSDQLATCLATVPAELLEKPHDKPTYDGKVGGFVAFLAFHETYHVGQVAYLRKWLGHGQVVG
jgi:uncharacterized damage-inducible protein DinB